MLCVLAILNCVYEEPLAKTKADSTIFKHKTLHCSTFIIIITTATTLQHHHYFIIISFLFIINNNIKNSSSSPMMAISFFFFIILLYINWYGMYFNYPLC